MFFKFWLIFVPMSILGYQIMVLANPSGHYYHAIPEQTSIKHVLCLNKEAILYWEKQNDAFQYIVEYKTNYNPYEWLPVYDYITGKETEYSMDIEPYTNYTFRLIAVNTYGRSIPSKPSQMCPAPARPPKKNPGNISLIVNQYGSLLISWDVMDPTQHAGPGFEYHIFWRQDTPGHKYSRHVIDEWRQNQALVPNVNIMEEYRVKIIAVNEKGECPEYASTTVTRRDTYKEIAGYVPRFKVKFEESYGSYTYVFHVLPDQLGSNFRYFYIQYKIYTDVYFQITAYYRLKENATLVVKENQVYVVRVTAVDGDYHVTSLYQMIDTYFKPKKHGTPKKVTSTTSTTEKNPPTTEEKPVLEIDTNITTTTPKMDPQDFVTNTSIVTTEATTTKKPMEITTSAIVADTSIVTETTEKPMKITTAAIVADTSIVTTEKPKETTTLAIVTDSRNYTTTEPSREFRKTTVYSPINILVRALSKENDPKKTTVAGTANRYTATTVQPEKITKTYEPKKATQRILVVHYNINGEQIENTTINVPPNTSQIIIDDQLDLVVNMTNTMDNKPTLNISTSSAWFFVGVIMAVFLILHAGIFYYVMFKREQVRTEDERENLLYEEISRTNEEQYARQTGTEPIQTRNITEQVGHLNPGQECENAEVPPPLPPRKDQVPVDEDLLVEVSLHEASISEVPADEVPLVQVPLDEVTAGEVLLDEVTADEVLLDEVAADEVPLVQVSLDEVAAGEVPLDEVTASEVLLDEVAADEVRSVDDQHYEVMLPVPPPVPRPRIDLNIEPLYPSWHPRRYVNLQDLFKE